MARIARPQFVAAIARQGDRHVPPRRCRYVVGRHDRRVGEGLAGRADLLRICRDRKSTRLNSSHTVISYAVFCLKKKKKTTTDKNGLLRNHIDPHQSVRTTQMLRKHTTLPKYTNSTNEPTADTRNKPGTRQTQIR